MRIFLNKIKNMFVYWGLCFKFKRLRRRDEMSFVMIDANKMLTDAIDSATYKPTILMLAEKALLKSGYKQWRPRYPSYELFANFFVYIKSDVDSDAFYEYIKSLRSKEMLADDDNTLYTVYRK